MTPRCKKFLLLTVLVLAISPLAAAQGTYTQIDYPGAITTSCYGINNAGDMTGFYIDSMGIYRGFLLSGSAYTTIDYPGAQSTTLYRSNDVGQIVGVADSFSFVYDEKKETFTEIAYPGSGATYATSINNAGTIAGFFTANDNFSQGFELIGSTYLALTPLKSANAYFYGITGMGELVGYTSGHENFNFSFEHGRYQQIVIPNNPAVYGINQTGTALVGVGFLYRNSILQPLRFPGGGVTYAFSVNDAGKVVGLFVDSNSQQHCFTWVP